MKGSVAPRNRRATKQFKKGRVCTDINCEQVLSIYNDNKQCFKHAPLKTPRIRGHIRPELKK